MLWGGVIMARPPRRLPMKADLHEMAAGTVAEPLADAAYRRVKAAVLDGSLPPGLQAADQRVAAQPGMSGTPVHTAVVRLEHEGWITLSARGALPCCRPAAETERLGEAGRMSPGPATYPGHRFPATSSALNLPAPGLRS